MRTSHLIFATASVLALTLQACGGDDSSVFGPGGANGTGNGTSGGSSSNPSGVNLGDAGGGVGASCAQSTSQAALVPVILVFMMDRSGSMSEDMKWPTVVSGLESFFADPASAGIQAAFVDFGLGRNGFLHISDLMPSYFGRDGNDDFQESVGRKTGPPRSPAHPAVSAPRR